MQSNRLILIIAVVAGIIAMAASFGYLQSASGSLSKETSEPAITVLVAANDLSADHVLDPADDVKPEKIPSRTFAFLARAAVKLDERGALRGRRINMPIPAGSPLLYSHLVGLSDLELAPGSRAVTINVDKTGVIGGILVPGDRIDLVLSWKIPKENERNRDSPFEESAGAESLGSVIGQAIRQSTAEGETGARIILSNVRVLAVGSRLNRARQQFMFESSKSRDDIASTVTLEVTPEEALELIRATGGGRSKLHTLLRPQAGGAAAPVAGSRLE